MVKKKPYAMYFESFFIFIEQNNFYKSFCLAKYM